MMHFSSLWSAPASRRKALGLLTVLGLLGSPGIALAQTPLTGAYTINSAVATGGTNFASFTEAVAALTTNGVSGAVTFGVSGGPYAEQISLGQITGTSATNTVTFNGNGSTIQFAPATSAARSVVQFNGADYVTLNNLLVNATGGTYGWGIHLTNASDNNRIRNCTVTTDIASTSTNFAGIVASGSNTSATTLGNAANFLTLEGNTVVGGYYGVILNGTSATALAGAHQIRNNQIRDFYLYGLDVENNDGAQLIGNNISRPNRTNGSTFYGIYISGNSRNVDIEKNRIHNPFDGNPTSTSSAYGVYITANDAIVGAENDVVNNLIYSFNGSGTEYALYNSSSDYTRYYHNTISLDNQAATTTSVTAGFYQTTLATGIEFKNNVVSVTRNPTGTGGKYALYFNTATSTIISDYNDLYVGTPGAPRYTATISTTPYVTLADWRAAASGAYDQNSQQTDPLFVSVAGGNYTPGAVLLNNVAQPLARVTDDITGAARSATPDLGAYEFTPQATDVAPVALIAPISGATCLGATEAVTVQIRNAGTSALNFAISPATVTVVVTPPSGAAQTLTATVSTGTLASGATQNVTLTGTTNLTALGTYSFAVTATVQGDQNATNNTLTPVSRTVLAPVAGTVSPTATSLCNSGTALFTLTGAANGTIQWQQSTDNVTFTDIAGATADTYTTPVLTSTRYFRARVGCNTNVATTTTATVTVNTPRVLTTSGPVTICTGSTATLTATAATGTSLRYFEAATGGTALATGPSFTTPALTASRQYFVEAFSGVQETAGAQTNSIGAGSGANLTYALIFDVTSATTLTGVYVYPTVAGVSNIQLLNSAGTVLQSYAATFAAADLNVKTFVPLNFSLPVGTGLRLGLLSTGSTASLYRNSAGATYPYASASGQVTITGNTFSGYPQYYYYFYDWQLNSECNTATRTAIQVNVGATLSAPTLTAAVQPNGSVLLTASGSSAGATYQFYRNNATVGTASTANTLLVSAAANNGSYTVVITSAAGCTAPSPASNAVAVAVTTSTGKPLAGTSLLLYPNPSPAAPVTLELHGYQKAATITVLNALGQVLLVRDLPAAAAATRQVTLDVATLPAGVYMVRVATEGGVDLRRLVRE